MPEPVGFDDATYGNLRSGILGAVRRETYGRDIGQNSWLTAEEAGRFGRYLNPGRDSRLRRPQALNVLGPCGCQAPMA